MTSQPKLETAPFIPRIEDPSPLPESERVIYDKASLETVICQFRFPAILKISSGPPADFQEGLRRNYPLFREIPPVDIATGFPAELVNVIGKLLPNQGSKTYEFSSHDGNWQVTLTQESLALTCKTYRRWEEFRELLELPLGLLLKIYEPPFFTRIGLRYRNVITRNNLGLEGVQWHELLSPELAGELHSQISAAIENTGHLIVMKLQGDVAKVTLQHGLGNKNNEICYIIDSDFYVNERTGAQNALRILDYFNKQASRLFHWCISDRLHQAMGPRSVSG
jgi:uncharacterized protein (TIGR04255 family)